MLVYKRKITNGQSNLTKGRIAADMYGAVEAINFRLAAQIEHDDYTVCIRVITQWRRANFDHPPPLNLLTDPRQNLHRSLRRGYLPPYKTLFRSDKGFRFRACTTSRTIVHSAILFWVLTITYSQDATTNINAKYIKRCGSAQGYAF